MAEPQYHFDPDTYLAMIRTEVPDYDTLQAEIRRATRGIGDSAAAVRVLDLGAGTGSTSRAVLDALPGAQLVLVDENPGMLAVATDLLPPENIERVVVADLSDPPPAGPFDLVVSALAIHHLDGAGKRALFAAVHERLRAGGRFAMADVVIPDNGAGAVTPLTDDYDKPDRGDDLIEWLRGAGFRTEMVWTNEGDLAVFVGDKYAAE
jgi:tRNA (cmo5U34)-methyltransferase